MAKLRIFIGHFVFSWTVGHSAGWFHQIWYNGQGKSFGSTECTALELSDVSPTLIEDWPRCVNKQRGRAAVGGDLAGGVEVFDVTGVHGPVWLPNWPTTRRPLCQLCTRAPRTGCGPTWDATVLNQSFWANRTPPPTYQTAKLRILCVKWHHYISPTGFAVCKGPAFYVGLCTLAGHPCIQ